MTLYPNLLVSQSPCLLVLAHRRSKNSLLLTTPHAISSSAARESSACSMCRTNPSRSSSVAARDSAPIHFVNHRPWRVARCQQLCQAVVPVGQHPLHRRSAQKLKRLRQGRVGRALAFASQQPRRLAEQLQELLRVASCVAPLPALALPAFAALESADAGGLPARVPSGLS